MAVKKKTKKKPAKKKTKTSVSSKKVKKKVSAKKKVKKPAKKLPKKTKKSAPKKAAVKKSAVKKSKTKKSAVKKPAQKKASKKPERSLKKQKSVSAKTSVQAPSYLSALEQELERILEKNRQVSIKGSEGFEYCFEENCDQPSTTGGYCRYHYMVSWGYIKKRNQILSENKLKLWTADLIQNHSPRILDYMVRDLSNEKDFAIALSEMKLKKKPSGY
ncbi:MAG: hypothetical protein OXK80_00790 [Bdellovibrionales bacterium]|nr:hypothetical protein [Bdellovibrionales bacterium]